MPYADTAQFKLSEDVDRDVRLVSLNRLKDAIQGAQERNDDEADYDAMTRGAIMEGMPKPWPGACDLVSTIIPEHITTLYANLMTFPRQRTLAEATARRADDKDKARLAEAFVADVWLDEGMQETLARYAWNVLKSKAAVIYAGWCEKTERVQAEQYAEYDPDTQWFKYWNEEAGQPDDLIEAEDRRTDGTVEYAAIPVMRDDVTKGAEYRVVELKDFFPYPPNAESIEKATCVFERLLLTEDDLLTGIDEYGYDEDTVMEMIRLGPTHTSSGELLSHELADDNARKDRIDGIDATVQTHGDGFYECFLGFGKLPKLWEDGKARLPEAYFQQEAQMLLCYQHNLIPLLVPCKYPKKPYCSRSLQPENNRFLGTGLVQQLEPLAQEATHLIRQTFNNLDLLINAEYKVTDGYTDRNKTGRSFPGKYHRVDQSSDIEPLRKDPVAQIGFEPLSYVDAKAQAVAASQGYAQLQTKVRKEAEVQNTVSAANTKFDLYAWNLFGTLIPELAAWRVEMQLLFDPDFGTQIYTPDGVLDITANDLRVAVRWSAAQMDADTSTEAKERKNGAKLGLQVGYMEAKRNFPEDAESLWYGARQALLDLGERNPEKWLGEKPPPFVPPPMPMDGLGMPGMLPMGAGMPPMGGLPGTGLPPLPQMAMNGMGGMG